MGKDDESGCHNVAQFNVIISPIYSSVSITSMFFSMRIYIRADEVIGPVARLSL